MNDTLFFCQHPSTKTTQALLIKENFTQTKAPHNAAPRNSAIMQNYEILSPYLRTSSHYIVSNAKALLHNIYGGIKHLCSTRTYCTIVKRALQRKTLTNNSGEELRKTTIQAQCTFAVFALSASHHFALLVIVLILA